MTTYNVTSGQTISGLTLNGGYLFINSGGIANGTIVNSGGGELIAGGIANGTVLNSGGEQIYSGGIANSTIVNSGGYETIDSGGIANGTIVNSGGSELIFAGGIASGTIVSSGGDLYMQLTSGVIESGSNGGYIINGVTIHNGALLSVELDTGATFFGLVVSAGCSEDIYGGIASGTIINSGGQETTYAGGIANGTIVNSGGYEIINFGNTGSGTTFSNLGGTANSTIVNSGGYQILDSGGIANGTIVNSGGSEIISAGGIASGTVVNDGGILAFSPTSVINNLNVQKGASLDLISTTATASTVNNLNQLVIMNGSLLVDTIGLSGTYTNIAFTTSPDGNGGTFITEQTVSTSGTVATFLVIESSIGNHGYAVIDSSSNIALNLDSLQAYASKIVSITQSGTPTPMNIIASQSTSDLSALGLISGPYNLIVTNPGASATLQGGNWNDTLIGGTGNDILVGGLGNDTLTGGAGIDTAVYSSALSNYTITKNTNGFTVTDKTGTEGTDTLTNIDRLHFSDVNVALDLNGNAGQVAKILGAVFGSGAVSNQLYVGIGLSYLDSGMSYSDLAALELNSAGALSHDAIVTRLWTNVVGSAPTAANKAPYLDMLNNGMKVGDLGVLAADTGLNINNINLAGLTQTGIEYTSMAGANILTGTSGNDTITGSSGNDLIMGLSGNDIIRGGAGNDVIDGGSGIDTSTYSSVRSNYTLVNNTSHFTVSSAVDGADTLINIERLQFSDVDVALDINGNAGQVAKILGAVFGAGSVSNQQYVGIGLNYLDNGMSYSDLAALAINAAGAKTNDAIVTLLWTNVVGSTPTDVNKAPYLDMLNQGQITVGGLGVLAAETSLNINNIHLVGLAQTGLEFIHV